MWSLVFYSLYLFLVSILLSHINLLLEPINLGSFNNLGLTFASLSLGLFLPPSGINVIGVIFVSLLFFLGLFFGFYPFGA